MIIVVVAYLITGLLVAAVATMIGFVVCAAVQLLRHHRHATAERARALRAAALLRDKEAAVAANRERAIIANAERLTNQTEAYLSAWADLEEAP